MKIRDVQEVTEYKNISVVLCGEAGELGTHSEDQMLQDNVYTRRDECLLGILLVSPLYA